MQLTELTLHQAVNRAVTMRYSGVALAGFIKRTFTGDYRSFIIGDALGANKIFSIKAYICNQNDSANKHQWEAVV